MIIIIIIEKRNVCLYSKQRKRKGEEDVERIKLYERDFNHQL